MVQVTSYSIGEAWLNSAQAVLSKGVEIDDDKGPIIELSPLFIEIINPSFQDRIIETYGNKIFLDFLAKNFQDLSSIEDWGYSYAQRLYSYNGINQIQRIIDKLKKAPQSKSATISLLMDNQDLKHKPCLVALDFKIRNTSLMIYAFFRSQDIGKKMYGDTIEVLKIGKIIAAELQLQKIAVSSSISSAHIYKADLEYIRAILDKENI